MKKIIFAALLIVMSMAFAETKLEFGGNIYNQYRWTDANTSIGGPFGALGAHTTAWAGRDQISKGNFMRTEVGLELNATISKHVKAYVYAKTIFDSDDGNSSEGANAAAWQTYWDDKTGWFKLRGFQIDLIEPVKFIDQVTLGTPYGLPFSKWLVADRRYIDRFNTKGIVVRGNAGKMVKWNAAKLWLPRWQTLGWGATDDETTWRNAFQAEDGNWVANVEMVPTDAFQISLDGAVYIDNEFDPEDGDNGAEGDTPDGIKDIDSRYMNYGIALTGKYDLTDEMSLDFCGLFTGQTVNDAFDSDDDNILDANLPWGTGPVPGYKDVSAPGGLLSWKTSDPFGVGFSPNVQGFYIHHNYVALNASRREHDMLMMDGGVDGLKDLNTFFWGGGQGAARHIDNDNLRLGEDMYEASYGYTGATLDINQDLDFASLDAQFNYIMATDNTGGKTDEDDPDFDGEGDKFMAARDFSGMVFDLDLKGKLNKFDLGVEFRYGLWEDLKDEDSNLDDHSKTAMVIGCTVGKQLTKSFSLEVNPAYHIISEEMDFNTEEDGLETMDDNRIAISHKWVYNFGGFDLWIRGEHVFVQGDSYDEDLSANAIHAAFEVKF